MSRIEIALAHSLAASSFDLAWFEAYPSSIYQMIKTLRKGNGDETQ